MATAAAAVLSSNRALSSSKTFPGSSESRPLFVVVVTWALIGSFGAVCSDDNAPFLAEEDQ